MHQRRHIETELRKILGDHTLLEEVTAATELPQPRNSQLHMPIAAAWARLGSNFKLTGKQAHQEELDAKAVAQGVLPIRRVSRPPPLQR